MKSISELFEGSLEKTFNKQVIYKTRRDEIVSLIVDDINLLRKDTTYKPVTKRMMAIRINKNPFLSKDDGELELVYKECKGKRNYSKLWWITKS